MAQLWVPATQWPLSGYLIVKVGLLSSHRSQEQLTGNVRRLSICVRPSIAHLETQYSWAQIRLAATSLGSRPTGMERRPRSRHTFSIGYVLTYSQGNPRIGQGACDSSSPKVLKVEFIKGAKSNQ